MAAGAETDKLRRVARVRFAFVIIALQSADVDEEVGGSGFAGEGVDCHGFLTQGRKDAKTQGVFAPLRYSRFHCRRNA